MRRREYFGQIVGIGSRFIERLVRRHMGAVKLLRACQRGLRQFGAAFGRFGLRTSRINLFGAIAFERKLPVSVKAFELRGRAFTLDYQCPQIEFTQGFALFHTFAFLFGKRGNAAGGLEHEVNGAHIDGSPGHGRRDTAMGFPPIEAVVEGCCCGGSADKKNDLFCARHGGEILSVHSELTSQFRIILGVFFALVYADSHGWN